jgi:anti-anti-sigma regulatory factor
MQARGDSPATIYVVVDEATELVLGRFTAADVDVRLVDLLARLALHTRRRGWRIRIADPPPQLTALLGLCGLDRVLGLEPPRQPELGEELGEDVVVQRRDPAV